VAEKPEGPLDEDKLYYWRRSRSLSHSIVAVLPLLVVYQCGIVLRGQGQRALVEVWLAGAVRHVGITTASFMNIFLVAALIAALWRSERTGKFCPHVVFVMWAEATFFALALYYSGVLVTDYLLNLPRQFLVAGDMSGWLVTRIVLGLGAGVYEELLFRLGLIGLGGLALRRLTKWDLNLCFALMLLPSSLAFSYVHHIGPSGEPFTMNVFVYRAVCGVFLGLLFIVRGFGITAWTHSLYNAMAIWQMSQTPG
jgi:hypothetical protein